MKKSAVEASLLLVDDDPSIIQVLSRILSDYTTVRFATSGSDALRLAKEALPDLILLDAQLGDMSGLEVCEALKADLSIADVPVIFVSSHQEAELEVAVLQMGAVDFIRKPFNASQVTARVNTQLKLKRLSDDLRKLSRIDGLTGLPNSRACEDTLTRELLRASESNQALSLVLLDVDCFKSFESLYGRKAADACLAAVAEVARRGVRRPGDFVARLDNDRFAVILPDTPPEGGFHVANRLLGEVEALDISHQGSSVSRHVTCSAGVASFDASVPREPDATVDHEPLHRAAGSALAQAKQAGRAQACLMSAPG